ncbi:MAG: cupin domain-containing protein [Caldisphaeraceae archaeon]|nr:cupin domain-containing protein [Caldisphaeraceae archaeon]
MGESMESVKPVVKNYLEVKEEKLSEDFGTGAYIRWLLRDNDGAKTFFMRYFRIEKGGHINHHFHPWEHEIFVLEGEGRIRIGSKVYRVSKGNFVFIPPNVDHEYWADTEMRFLCMIPSKPTAEKLDKPIDV